MHILHFLPSLPTLSQKNLKHWGLCAPEFVRVELGFCMERFLAFPQFPVCTCRKWYQASGSLIFVEPETLKAVNYFLSAGKSCPFSLHESTADSELLHGTAVYSIYKKGSVDVLSSCLCSQSITKSCLWAQILPLKGACHLNSNLCQRKMRVSQMGTCGGDVLIPSLSSAASSQTLWDMRMPWFMGDFVVWGFFSLFFSQQNYPSILQGAKWHRVNIISSTRHEIKWGGKSRNSIYKTDWGEHFTAWWICTFRPPQLLNHPLSSHNEDSVLRVNVQLIHTPDGNAIHFDNHMVQHER